MKSKSFDTLRKIDDAFLGGKHAFIGLIDDADTAVFPMIDDESWAMDVAEGYTLAKAKAYAAGVSESSYKRARKQLTRLLKLLTELDKTLDSDHKKALAAVAAFKPKAK